MEIALGPDETLLRDTVGRYLEKEYGFEARARRMAEPDGFCRHTWREMAGLGLVAAGLPDEAGGLGAGALGTMIVAEAFGRALVVEPYLSTAVLGAGALELGGQEPQRALLARVAEGDCLLGFAHLEPGGEEDASPASVCRRAGGRFRLDGAKAVVLHAAAADHLVVTARLESPGQAASLALLLVPRDAPGLSLCCYRTPDGFPAADVTFEAVPLEEAALLCSGPVAEAALERVVDRANAALCAEAVGAMEALLARTTTYLGTRQQFGVPLARFQALQHRVADMAMELEQARSMMLVAARHADAIDVGVRRRCVSAAKARMARAARFIAQNAVQLHGGIGMTEALDVSHYFRRLTVIAQSFGDEEQHLERFLAASGR